jgi:hypothetical protein
MEVDLKALAEKADQYYLLNKRRLAAQKEVDAIETEEKTLKAELIASIELAEAQGVAGKVCRVTVVTKAKPTLRDFDALLTHCKRRNEWDLIRHAISEEAVKQRWAVGKEVPGVESFAVTTLSVNKL